MRMTSNRPAPFDRMSNDHRTKFPVFRTLEARNDSNGDLMEAAFRRPRGLCTQSKTIFNILFRLTAAFFLIDGVSCKHFLVKRFACADKVSRSVLQSKISRKAISLKSGPCYEIHSKSGQNLLKLQSGVKFGDKRQELLSGLSMQRQLMVILSREMSRTMIDGAIQLLESRNWTSLHSEVKTTALFIAVNRKEIARDSGDSIEKTTKKWQCTNPKASQN
ncbi:hypothetical protein TNCV_3924891 [Trichonephila clavipes]|nr:hypothetical protein TNCV_3924891 [Trichonephila clavipes]